LSFLSDIELMMTEHFVTTSNWSYQHYQNDKIRAFISIGAKPDDKNEDEIIDCFFVTVTDPDYKEIFQKEFANLEAACDYLNLHYAHWNLQDRRISASGCSTCHAH
jgi:hypothetical protein